MDDQYLSFEENSKETIDFVEAQRQLSINLFQKKNLASKNPGSSEPQPILVDIRDNMFFALKVATDRADILGYYSIGDNPESELKEFIPIIDLSYDYLKGYQFSRLLPGGSSKKVLIAFSRGGADATRIVPLDIANKRFDPPIDLPEGRIGAAMLDDNTALVSYRIESGCILQRLDLNSRESHIVSKLPPDELFISPWILHDDCGVDHAFATHAASFHDSHTVGLIDKKLVRLPFPKQALSVGGLSSNQLLIVPGSKFEIDSINCQNGLIGLNWPLFRDYGKSYFSLLYNPRPKEIVRDAIINGEFLFVVVEQAGYQQLVRLKVYYDGEIIKAVFDQRAKLPGDGSIGRLFPLKNNAVLLEYSDYATPVTQLVWKASGEVVPKIKIREPHRPVNSSRLMASSSDGAQIPFFIVDGREDKAMPAPLILECYGGFGRSRTPWYNNLLDSEWLQRGNIYVYAAVRGGGELGQGWHEAGRGPNKSNSVEDFAAVAIAVVDLGFTSPSQLALRGWSNGGLIAAATAIKYPNLSRAIVLQSAVLDMLRYHVLGPGAMWRDEYGWPEELNDREFLSKLSPLNNLSSKLSHLSWLVLSSSNDDRVHPAHSRKFVAKLQDLRITDSFLFESTTGGHTGSFESKLLEYEFLKDKLEGHSIGSGVGRN